MERILSTTIHDLMKELSATKVEVIAKYDIGYGESPVLEDMKALKDARVIVVSASAIIAAEIMCDAYKLEMYGTWFVWIFTRSNEFWKLPVPCCTKEEMQRAVEGSFFLDTVEHDPFEEMGISNITHSGLIADIVHRFYAQLPFYYTFAKYAVGKCYDHVWVAALALNCSLNSLDALDDETTLSESRNMLTDCIDKLDFVGTTGRIKFEEGALIPLVVLQRVQDANATVVAYFRQNYRPNVSYEWTEGALIWKDNIIPSDSALRRKEKSIPLSLYLTIYVLAGVGIMVTITCFFFNVVWRKHRIVKMSSPNINSIILAGCLLLHVTIVLKTTATTTQAICASIRDKHLLVIIGIVVTMETIVLTVWESFSPHHVFEQQMNTEMVTTDSGEKIAVMSFYRVCVSEHSNYFIWTLQIMNGAFIAFGAFLAWETRHVHIDALNDSRTIGICLYNVVILSAVELVLSLMLADKPIELLGVNSVCLFAGTLVSEMLIFLPKMLAVFRNPMATTQTAVKTLESLPPSNIAIQSIEVVTLHSPEQDNTN